MSIEEPREYKNEIIYCNKEIEILNEKDQNVKEQILELEETKNKIDTQEDKQFKTIYLNEARSIKEQKKLYLCRISLYKTLIWKEKNMFERSKNSLNNQDQGQRDWLMMLALTRKKEWEKNNLSK